MFFDTSEFAVINGGQNHVFMCVPTFVQACVIQKSKPLPFECSSSFVLEFVCAGKRVRERREAWLCPGFSEFLRRCGYGEVYNLWVT